MNDLKILGANQLGFGYLIEHDSGHISPSDNRNVPFINEMKSLNEGNAIIAEPYYVYAVLQKYGVKNRNGRIYPEDVLKEQAIAYQSIISQRMAIGELDHPADSIISGERISHNIVEMWWEDNSLVGKLEILMSPGFIKLGIVSTLGDQVANLLRHNIKIGVSSRGVGSVEDVGGIQLVQSDFELICWDIVTNPSTIGSWIYKDKQKNVYRESIDSTKEKLLNGVDVFLSKKII